ncbi:MAG: hypothetical protein M3O61_05050 [Gemmatimonadota bacterium]|nr:hypothetical protein [Gemmatimonadota bacterium]
MTTSRETESLDHPAIRELVNDANSMSLAERLTLIKGLIPAIASQMRPEEFEKLIKELRLKGERFYEATSHPNEGRATRQVMGERDVEGR